MKITDSCLSNVKQNCHVRILPRVAGCTLLCFMLGSGCLSPPSTGDRPSSAPRATWVSIAGETYGARAGKLGNIGGGTGYARIIRGGDYQVRTIGELRHALKQAKPGEVVFVDGDVEMDGTALAFTESPVLEVPEGVTLASDRGHKGSAGALIYSDTFATYPLIRVMGPDVRVTGLRIRGPDMKRRTAHHVRSFATNIGDRKAQSKYYYSFPTSDGIHTNFARLTVDNCELSGWSHGAIVLRRGDGHHVHHNSIHHNQRLGLGYGVSLDVADALIEDNIFDWNRHHIAGTGREGCSYEARNNLVLENCNGHLFDMHGGGDRGDGTTVAGTRILIHHNTFRATSAAAFVLRGTPIDTAELHHNWFMHRSRREAIGDLGDGSRTHVEQNVYSDSAVFDTGSPDMEFGEIGEGDPPTSREITLNWGNPLPATVDLDVRWDLRGGHWTIDKIRQSLTVDARQNATMKFIVTSPCDNLIPVPAMSIRARYGKANLLPQSQRRLIVQVRKKLPHLPGGRAAATDYHREYIKSYHQLVMGGHDWKGARDCSAVVFLGRGADGMHVVVEVTDDKLFTSDTVGGIWQFDSVEFYLDTRTPDARDKTYGEAGVHQIIVSPSPIDGKPAVMHSKSVIENVSISTKKSKHGYRIELIIPYTSLPDRLKKASETIRFDVGVNDADSKDGRQHQLMLWGTKDNWMDPSRFGALEF